MEEAVQLEATRHKEKAAALQRHREAEARRKKEEEDARRKEEEDAAKRVLSFAAVVISFSMQHQVSWRALFWVARCTTPFVGRGTA
jgi:negative regulator of genetic competence, sporulation and motility